MSVVGFLQSLLDAGLPLEAAMMAARLHEQAMEDARPKRSKGAERQARYEARKRQKASESVSADADDAPDAPPEEKVPPTPPSKTQTPTPPSPPKGGSSPTISPKPNGFARFWEAYPRREAKRTAETAYAKALKRIATADPGAVILAGVARARGSRQWREGFVPHAATWLNRDGWDDETEPRQQDPPGPAEPVTDAERQRRLRHLRDTGEWRDAWGEKPQEIAA